MEYELYLTHFNIKGSHWGDRRFQYKDGTLTPAGKLRYRKGGDNPRHKPSEARKKAKYEANRADLLEKGSATDLLKNRKKYNFTDAELKKAADRIKTHVDVESALKSFSEKELEKGKSWLDKTLDASVVWKDRAEKGLKVWNFIAGVHNSIVDDDDAWQQLGEGKKSVAQEKRERAEKKRKDAEEKAKKEKKDKEDAEKAKMAADAAIYKDLDLGYDELKKYASTYNKDELKKAYDFLEAKKKNAAIDKANKEAKEKSEKEARDAEEFAKQKMITEAVFNKRIDMNYDELKKYASAYSKDELERRIAGLEARKRAAQEKADREAKAAKEKADREAKAAKEKAAKANKEAKAKADREAKKDAAVVSNLLESGSPKEILENRDKFTSPEQFDWALQMAYWREERRR